jgi:hypothetical protein
MWSVARLGKFFALGDFTSVGIKCITMEGPVSRDGFEVCSSEVGWRKISKFGWRLVFDGLPTSLGALATPFGPGAIVEGDRV